MFLQDNDPHHLHDDPVYFYAYFILAPIVMVVVLYVGWKLMTFYEKRRDRSDGSIGREKTDEKSGEN